MALGLFFNLLFTPDKALFRFTGVVCVCRRTIDHLCLSGEQTLGKSAFTPEGLYFVRAERTHTVGGPHYFTQITVNALQSHAIERFSNQESKVLNNAPPFTLGIKLFYKHVYNIITSCTIYNIYKRNTMTTVKKRAYSPHKSELIV